MYGVAKNRNRSALPGEVEVHFSPSKNEVWTYGTYGSKDVMFCQSVLIFF